MTNDTSAEPESAQLSAPNLLRSLAHRLVGTPELPVEGRLPSFDGATGWLNSEALSPAALRGRVVVVDFWTYTCINWLRTAPYRRAWDAKYRHHGLTLIGAHTPEFGFERDIENVTRYVGEYGVEFPVAVDSDYGVWRAFDNHYWPALYVADADGRIRWHHFGEGEYAMAEMVIQRLLAEAGAGPIDTDLVGVEPRGFEVGADFRTLRTPETYLGASRASGYGSPHPARPDEAHDYPEVGPLNLNEWAPVGPWTIAEHASIADGTGARIEFRFQARDVNLVMGPVARGGSIPFRVRLDGAVPGEGAGFDIDGEGRGTLSEQRLYQLVRQSAPIAPRTVEIEFLEAGAEAYCFTFG